MSFKPRLIASAMSLLVAMTLLTASGCALAPGARVICLPELEHPPESVIDALVKAAAAAPDARDWIIGLEKHLEEQDAARPQCAARQR